VEKKPLTWDQDWQGEKKLRWLPATLQQNSEPENGESVCARFKITQGYL
jgi:hypothetical protein